MAYTDAQAKRKAQQIYDRFGQLIHDACLNTGVAESFLAGFTGVEAGIDSKGNIKPEAVRFEKGVYADLISLRDNGFCFVGGQRKKNYSGITQLQLAGLSDASIRNLSTSFSFSQIMGWWTFWLGCTIAELRDPQRHFHYTVKLLKHVGGSYMRRGDLEAVLRIWNTGSANGKTYHADYPANALKVKKFYEQILKTKGLYQDSAANQTEEVQPTVFNSNTSAADFAAFDSNENGDSGFSEMDQTAANLIPNSSEFPAPPLDGLPTDDKNSSTSMTLKEEIETPEGTLQTAEFTRQKPIGDTPDQPARSFFNIEDWKPWVFGKLKLNWTTFTGVNFAQGTSSAFAALKSGEYWYVPLLISAAIFIFSLLFAAGVSLVLLAIWYFNRREISTYKTEQLRALHDPNKFNFGLNIERVESAALRSSPIKTLLPFLSK
jgi:hypothetical protein